MKQEPADAIGSTPASPRKVRTIEVKRSIFEDNNARARQLRKELSDQNTLLINVMSSPGSGKTTTLLRVLDTLKDKYKIGVMEADIDSDTDARKIQEAGVDSIQLHTGGMCHLDADMTRQGLQEIDAENYDLIFLENVGNLVCPAEFDTGAHLNLAILSVPEGDDKPLKYPLMFQVCQALVINKTDVLDYFDFDLDKVTQYALQRNPNLKLMPISAKTGDGIDQLTDWIEAAMQKHAGKQPSILEPDQ